MKKKNSQKNILIDNDFIIPCVGCVIPFQFIYSLHFIWIKILFMSNCFNTKKIRKKFNYIPCLRNTENVVHNEHNNSKNSIATAKTTMTMKKKNTLYDIIVSTDYFFVWIALRFSFCFCLWNSPYFILKRHRIVLLLISTLIHCLSVKTLKWQKKKIQTRPNKYT